MIYFLKSEATGENVKIGFTRREPEERAKEFQLPGVKILASIEGDREVEKSLHERFKHLRLEGSEFFEPGPDLLSYIESLQGEPDAGLLPNAIQTTLRQMDDIYRLIGGGEW